MMQRDELGRIQRPGRSVVKRWEATSGAIPSWLTLASTGADAGGAVTFGVTAFGEYIQLAPATTGTQATISAAAIDTTEVTMLRVTVEGLTVSHPSIIGYNIGAWDDVPSRGARLSLPTATASLTVASFPTAGNPAAPVTNYQPRIGAEFKKPRTLSQIQYPQTRWNYALEGDSTLAAFQHTLLGKGAGVIPRVRALTSDATPRWMRFSALEIEVVYAG